MRFQCYQNAMPKIVKQKLVKLVCFVSETRKDGLDQEAEQLGINVSELVRRKLDERQIDVAEKGKSND